MTNLLLKKVMKQESDCRKAIRQCAEHSDVLNSKRVGLLRKDKQHIHRNEQKMLQTLLFRYKPY